MHRYWYSSLTKLLFLFMLPVLFLTRQAKANEGMWLLPLLKEYNMEKMHSMGLNLDAADIYHPEKPSLSDAVAIFGGICTAELISDQGLLLTNHHCGYDYIHEHSTMKNNYLKNGFWAQNKEEELSNPDLQVKFLKTIKDVTDTIQNAISDTLTEKARNDTIDKISRQLASAAEEESYLDAEVKSFYKGTRFYLFVYKVFRDVRLVGTPPSSIGKFGGDEDNWTWPRHTGDFSLFRVYCGPDGQPADYDEDNVPYEPETYFSLSTKGFRGGDYAMIMGFPGNTKRYITSAEIQTLQDIIHPNRINIRGKLQKIIKKMMQKDDTIRLKYASKYSRSSNYYKYSIGQKKCIKEESLIQQRKQLERQFNQWALQQNRFKQALPLINQAEKQQRPYQHAFQYINETLFRGSGIISLASQMSGLKAMIQHDTLTKERKEEIRLSYKETINNHFENYHQATDKKITKAMLQLLRNNVRSPYLPNNITHLDTLNNNRQTLLDTLYNTSVFRNKNALNAFLENPDTTVLKQDPAYQIAQSASRQKAALKDSMDQYAHKEQKGERLYLKGLQTMFKDSNFYPNANFTMRLTYGQIQGYTPKDAVYYEHTTTLKGVMEKQDSTRQHFSVPDRLEDLFQQKKYADYTNPNQNLPVNFITNNDITGGNSGSPVINAEGELIGTAFDGNWESMCGDLQFMPSVQRCIAVDIRYVLFIIDQYAQADHLLKEMKINH